MTMTVEIIAMIVTTMAPARILFLIFAASSLLGSASRLGIPNLYLTGQFWLWIIYQFIGLF
jgi:hypothetical protein